MDLTGLRVNKVNNQLNANIMVKSLSAVSNVYTLDLSQYYNFKLETLDTVAKTIAFSNVPNTSGVVLSVSLKIKFTNNAAITFPASVSWQDGIAPAFNVGKQYILSFISYDNGTTWLGATSGAW